MSGLVMQENEISAVLKNEKRPIDFKQIRKLLTINISHDDLEGALFRMHKKHTVQKMHDHDNHLYWADPSYADLRLIKRSNGDGAMTSMGHALINATRVSPPPAPKTPIKTDPPAGLSFGQQLKLPELVILAMVTGIETTTAKVHAAVERRLGKSISKQSILNTLNKLSEGDDPVVEKSGHLRSVAWKKLRHTIIAKGVDEQDPAEDNIPPDSDVDPPTSVEVRAPDPTASLPTATRETGDLPTYELSDTEIAAVNDLPVPGATNIAQEKIKDSPLLEKLLQKFPDYDASWSAEVQAAWLTAYSRIFESLCK